MFAVQQESIQDKLKKIRGLGLKLGFAAFMGIKRGAQVRKNSQEAYIFPVAFEIPNKYIFVGIKWMFQEHFP